MKFKEVDSIQNVFVTDAIEDAVLLNKVKKAPVPLVSIVIINFNGKQFLNDCFESIKKYATFPYEIILFDNASSDGSAEYVQQNYPDVRFVSSPINTGFTGGNNSGAKLAAGKYLLLLNNDTVIRTPLMPMVEKMEENPTVGVLGCQLFYGNGQLQESIGYNPSVLGLVLSWTPLARIFRDCKKIRRTVVAGSNLYKKEYIEVDWVSGACLLTRADLWNKLGGLDEKYFMYMEEVDYCLRVWESGRSVAYTSLSQVTHFEGAGRPWIGSNALLNTANSYMVYVSKFHGFFSLIMLCVLLAPVFLMRSLGYLVLYLVRVDYFGFEKSRAYFKAALRLIFRGIFH